MRRPLFAVCAAALLGAAMARGADDGCPATPIGCGGIVRGRLAAGDCTARDGTPYDVLRFDGSAGRYVRAIVYAQSPLLTNTSIVLQKADGDGTLTPLVSGGDGGSVAYVPPASGPLMLTVGTRDAGASGDYLVAVSCHDWYPPELRSCHEQTISCGQTAQWNLTPQSCTFSDAFEKAYAAFLIYAVAGDTLSVEMQSNDFSPSIGIYNRHGGYPLLSSKSVTSSHDTIVFTVPATDVYQIIATSEPSSTYGRFALTVHGCASPACLPPTLLAQPADVAVPAGSRATLTAAAVGQGELRYVWYDRSSVPLVPVGAGERFVTPPVNGTQFYGVSVTTPCGDVDSRIVTVRPAPPRNRPARR